MKLARYIGGGRVAIVDEPAPSCPAGGLLVRTEACGLCSGELMDWYMDRKVPHVLGHEVAGIVEESQDERFAVNDRVFVHHHAPCMNCAMCLRHLYVHCEQWKRTKLVPGGMAEYFAVDPANLTDAFVTNDLRAIDAALIEPLACVVKSLRMAYTKSERPEGNVAVIGLGVMGLMHILSLLEATKEDRVVRVVGYDTNDDRIAHGKALELDARHPDHRENADVVFVCPGNKSALDMAIDMANPGATIILFAPMPPGEETPVNLNSLYFKDVRLMNSYSCGPDHTRTAAEMLRRGLVKAEHVVSDFITIDELPEAYQRMKKGEILKPMVVF